MLTPHYAGQRDVFYLNYSQMALFEMSPERYLDEVVYGHKKRISRNIALGSQMAKGLELGEATGDPLLDLMMAKIPKFELMDIPIEADLPHKKDAIHLIAKPDSAKADYSAFKEYKTSVRKWTQKMVDESGQITFYTTVIWLKTKQIPKDIELVDIETAHKEDGSLTATGAMWRFPTKRTMADILKMTARMRHAWDGIKELCAKELL